MVLTSPILISASVNCSPFCKILIKAAGGTKLPFMFDCDMCDSMPNVYAECLKPVNINLVS